MQRDRLMGQLIHKAFLRVGEDISKDRERLGMLVSVFSEDLEDFRDKEIEQAFKKLFKTLRYAKQITPGAIIDLIPNKFGHLDPEHAWNHAPKTEHDSAYVTEEIMSALGSASDSIDRGDMIAARKAFLESYEKILMTCVANGKRANYFYSGATMGSHEQRVQTKIDKTLEAAQIGLIPQDKARERLSILSSEIGTDPVVTLAKLGIDNVPRIKEAASVRRLERVSQGVG